MNIPQTPILTAILVLLVCFADPFTAKANGVLHRKNRTNGKETIKAFDQASEGARQSTVTIFDGETKVALGTVVSSSGFILSKASNLPENPSIRIQNGRDLNAKLIGVDSRLDLALLSVPTECLNPIVWSKSSAAQLGEWVIAPGRYETSLVGIISAKKRGIQRAGGALGVRLGSVAASQEGVPIQQVYPDSAAEAAGLKPQDRIKSINGNPTDSPQNLIKIIKAHDPGDTIRVEILRGGALAEKRATLGYRSIFDAFDRNQLMSGPTSNRRTGFKEVIQHDIPLQPHLMGGPLVNLAGESIGINIARVDRVTTYALPSELVIEAFERLKAKHYP